MGMRSNLVELLMYSCIESYSFMGVCCRSKVVLNEGQYDDASGSAMEIVADIRLAAAHLKGMFMSEEGDGVDYK